MTLTDGELRALILAALQAVAPDADLAAVDGSRPFRDQLGIDSVDFLNFVMTLERRLGLRVPETDWPQLSTLDGCLAYLAARQPTAAAPPSP